MTADSSTSTSSAATFWSFDIYPQIVKPFLEEILYLRIPVFAALLSFFLFSSIDQTLEVYLAFALDGQSVQIVLSTFFVFLLSGFTWYSARYLAEKRVESMNDNILKSHYQQRGDEQYPPPFVRYAFLWGVAFILGLSSLRFILQSEVILILIGLWSTNFLWLFSSKGSWLIAFFRWTFSRIQWLIVELQQLRKKALPEDKRQKQPDRKSSGIATSKTRANALIHMPRIVGIMPLLSFGFGWSKLVTEKSAVFTDPHQQLWTIGYSILIIYIITPLFIFATENRKSTTQSQQGLKPDQTLGHHDSLFDDKGEIIFFILAFIIFSGFTLPMLQLNSFGGLLAVLGLFLLMYLLLFLWNRDQDETIVYGGTILRGALISLGLSIVFFFYLPPVFFPTFLGPIVVLSLFLLCVLFIANTIFYWGKIHSFPTTGLLIVLVFVASSLNLNDNHRFTSLKRPQDWQALSSLDVNFEQWLEHKQAERKIFEAQGQDYPIYILSAQGGGIYAAYHTAAALSRLQDRFPNFADHLFAISSVSGGSVGATTFSSLVKSQVCDSPDSPKDCLETKAKQILGQDLLSPLLAVGLFPDMVQRFLPFPIYDWDRARGLEAAFERAWDKVLPSHDAQNPLQQSFYKHWNAASSAPALVLNTTMVETGKRLVISPFTFQLSADSPTTHDIRAYRGGINSTLDDIRTYDDRINPKLSTAAGLSARFPIITPVGWFKDLQGTQYRLADGGYFDNSGLLTALEVGERLEAYIMKHHLKAQIVYLSIIDQPTPTEQPTTSLTQATGPAPIAKAAGLNELLSPVRVLLNSRKALSQSIVQEVESSFAADPNRFRKILLDKTTTPLPLGWYLSSSSQCAIDAQVNPAFYQKMCSDSNHGLAKNSLGDRNASFAAVEQQIQHDLRPM